MSETPFYLKMSFRGEDASRWESHKYTMLAIVGWKMSDSFCQVPMSIRDKVDKIRDFISNAPTLRFDARGNMIIADISPNISISMNHIVKQSQLPDIAEESDDLFQIEPLGYVIADCNDVHIRCQDDIVEMVALKSRISAIESENELLRGLIFRR